MNSYPINLAVLCRDDPDRPIIIEESHSLEGYLAFYCMLLTFKQQCLS